MVSKGKMRNLPQKIISTLELMDRLRGVHEYHLIVYRKKHDGQVWDINAQLNHIHSEVSEVYELIRGKHHGKPIEFPPEMKTEEEKMDYIKHLMILELWDVVFSAVAGMEMLEELDLALLQKMEITLRKIEHRVGIFTPPMVKHS